MLKRALIGLLLSAVLLFFFFRNIDLTEIWDYILKGKTGWLVLAIVLNLFNFYLRAVRWRYFLLPIKRTGIWNLFETTIIGFAVSSILPARVGEVVRPYLLGNKENISRSAAFATIVVERLFDTLTILLLLVVYLFFLGDPEKLGPSGRASFSDLKKAGILVFLGVVGVIVFLYYLKTKPTVVKTLVRKIERRLPNRFAHSVDDLLESFIEGLSILHDPKILLQIMVWSIGFWLVIAAGFWAGFRAYLEEFAFFNTFLIMIILAIGIAVPTPGGVGGYHLACKIGLTRFFGVPDAQAGAIAVVTHFINFTPVLILGALFLWHEGLTAGKIQKIAQRKEEEGGEAISERN